MDDNSSTLLPWTPKALCIQSSPLLSLQTASFSPMTLQNTKLDYRPLPSRHGGLEASAHTLRCLIFDVVARVLVSIMIRCILRILSANFYTYGMFHAAIGHAHSGAPTFPCLYLTPRPRYRTHYTSCNRKTRYSAWLVWSCTLN